MHSAKLKKRVCRILSERDLPPYDSAMEFAKPEESPLAIA